MKIELKDIDVSKNTLVFKIKADDDASKFLSGEKELIYIYDTNIEKVPLSILSIPFISNFLPFIFAFNCELLIDQIDSEILNSIDDLRHGYQAMIPEWKMGGKVSYNSVVKTIYKVDKNALLFSGGIDAMNSLVVNTDKLDDLISIWGSDIEFNNSIGWEKTFCNIEDIAKKFDKKAHVIRSNFRSFLNEEHLDACVKKVNDTWWHGFQHGVALIGQVAPLAFSYGYKTVYIASSFTKEYSPICASSPLTDNMFYYGRTKTIHDGFEFDRSSKVENICNFLEEKKLSVKLHVCWESQSGQNCGFCEKCIRSYLNCLSVNKNPDLLGLHVELGMDQIKKRYLKKTYFGENEIDRFRVFKKHILENYNPVPKNLKWIVDMDCEKLNKRFYWKARHYAGRMKRKLLKMFKSNL